MSTAGGRLPLTWYPKDFVKVPMTDMRMRPDPSTGYPGRTYRFYQGEKVFEFGYGLSYSKYSYKFASVTQNKLNFKKVASIANNLENPSYVSVSDIGTESCEKTKFTATVRVENEGKMAGKHPVLLFIRREQGSNGSPMKQLVGFQTVSLNSEEKASVEFQVSPCEHFGRADEDGKMVIESGKRYLVVGDQEYAIALDV